MICSKCNSTIKDGSKFCIVCGNKVGDEHAEKTQKEKKHNKKFVVIPACIAAVLIIAAALAAGILLFGRSKSDNNAIGETVNEAILNEREAKSDEGEKTDSTEKTDLTEITDSEEKTSDTVDGDDRYKILSDNKVDFSGEQVLDYALYNKYENEDSLVSFSYPASLFCDIKNIAAEDDKAYGKKLEEVKLMCSDETYTDVSIYNNPFCEGDSNSEMALATVQLLEAELLTDAKVTSHIVSTDGEYAMAVIEGYTDESRSTQVYDLCRVDSVNIKRMYISYKTPADMSDYFAKGYYLHAMTQLCDFGDDSGSLSDFESYKDGIDKDKLVITDLGRGCLYALADYLGLGAGLSITADAIGKRMADDDTNRMLWFYNKVATYSSRDRDSLIYYKYGPDGGLYREDSPENFDEYVDWSRKEVVYGAWDECRNVYKDLFEIELTKDMVVHDDDDFAGDIANFSYSDKYDELICASGDAGDITIIKIDDIFYNSIDEMYEVNISLFYGYEHEKSFRIRVKSDYDSRVGYKLVDVTDMMVTTEKMELKYFDPTFDNGVVKGQYYNGESYETDYNELVLTEWEDWNIGEDQIWLDFDNDGEVELLIGHNNPFMYGGIILDFRSDGLYILTEGEGTAAYLTYTYHDGKILIVHSDISHVGREVYAISEYMRDGRLVEEYSLYGAGEEGPEDWEYFYRDKPISREEFIALRKEYYGN